MKSAMNDVHQGFAEGYEYSRIDRLQNPHSYMYTKFLGREFLDAYAESRNESIEYFSHLYVNDTGEKKPGDIDGIVADYLKGVFREVRPCEDILGFHETGMVVQTRDVLNISLYLIERRRHDKINDIYFVLSGFIRKYETFKRIFSAYGKDFRKSGDEYKDIDCYVLLGTALGLYFREFGNLKFLNCQLKINDLLCSVSNDIRDKEMIAMANASLRLELDAVESLMKKKGVI
jgi:hypothetical protein